MIVAAIDPQREPELRALLASMNREPGIVDPENSLLPFGELEHLHFARFVILDDQTLEDVTQYGLPQIKYPLYLVFLGDIDGDIEAFLTLMVNRAGDGLRRVFACCDGFAPEMDLIAWMKVRLVTPATNYINWVGRTVQQVKEEDRLRQFLESFIQNNSAVLQTLEPEEARNTLRKFVADGQQAGRITLTPLPATPFRWKVRNLAHLVGVPLVLLLLSPLLLCYLPVFLFQLRRREKTDPEIAPRVNPAHTDHLAILEDHDVTNQFSAIGSLKPGRFRLWTIQFLLWIIDYTTRHIYNRGHLARVSTIHFARWVFLDNKKRLLFASNYDGSLESYMDDFINKVGFGLNVVFSNGIGYPKTNWLFLDGAKDEQKFKNFLRRHQLPTEVWYSAHPGLSASDKWRNSMIRQGLERVFMTESEARQWLALF